MAPRRRKPPSPNPVYRSHLSDSEIMRILTLAHTGLSSRAIAAQVGRGQTTVLRITYTYNYETFKNHIVTHICKPKTTAHQDCILLRFAKIYND